RPSSVVPATHARAVSTRSSGGLSRSKNVAASDELRDLPLRPEASALDHLGVARAAQVRRDHQEAGEVQLSPSDDAPELRVLMHEPRRRSAPARDTTAPGTIHALRD